MNDRLSSPSTIESVLTPYHEGIDKAGPVLYYDHLTSYMETMGYNGLFLGTTGSGKSRRGTIPLVRSIKEAKQCFAVVDPKKEIYYHTACYNQDLYNTLVFDFVDILRSPHTYNPLDWPYTLYKNGDFESRQMASEIIDAMALQMYPTPEHDDPFWCASARDMFCGVVDILFQIGKREEINLASVYNIISEGDQKQGIHTILKNYLLKLPSTSNAAMLLRSYTEAPNDTKNSMKSVFLGGLSNYVRNEGLKQFTCKPGFDIAKLDPEKPTAIYICIPDEVRTYDTIAAVLVTHLSMYYLKCARTYPIQRLPIPMNIVLEELGNIGIIPNLKQIMSAGRSRNIRTFFALQSFYQLYSIYGQNDALTILDNVNSMIVYRLHDVRTMNDIVKQCGEYTIQTDMVMLKRNLITEHDIASGI